MTSVSSGFIYAHDGTVLIDKSSFCCHAAGKSHEVWQGLHASPRSAPSKGAKLCTYHRWVARIGPVPEPYFQLPISDRCMRRLFRFRLGAYALPIEMGRRLRMARVARDCPLCPGMHVGDARHYVFECPAFDDIRRGFLMIAMGPCDFSCGIRVRRTLLPACCSSLIGSMTHRSQ